MSPSEGEAVKSKFKITCQDWNDEDFPLTYQVDYSSDGNNTNTIYKNKSSACETVFGPGKEIYYFKIFIVVKIYDHIGAFARYQFTITVCCSHFMYICIYFEYVYIYFFFGLGSPKIGQSGTKSNKGES